ncbi:MAG: cell envelope integrity protein TolA [Acidibacter sp.]|nr:cell envelope integrity protein TolA [Acidibacter sp.]
MSSQAGRWRPFILSVLLHGALVAVIMAGGWWVTSPSTPPLQTLAIEATVVDASEIGALRPSRQPAVAPQPEPEPEPELQPESVPVSKPPVEPTPPKPDRAKEQAQREAEAKRVAEAKRKAEAEAKRKAEAEAEAKRKAEAEAESKRKAAAEAEDRRIKAEREAELQRALSAEEDRRNASRLAGLGAQWAQAIQARVQRAWIRPPSAKAGLDCLVIVTQVPGGTVVRAEVRTCNGDEAVKQSIEAAVFRASPLPPPPDPALFERTLELRFRPYD